MTAFAALGWIRRPGAGDRPLSRASAFGIALAVNLITHPVFWSVALRMTSRSAMLLGETVVVVVEGLIVFSVVVVRRGADSIGRRLGWSMLCALAANALSLAVGVLMAAG